MSDYGIEEGAIDLEEEYEFANLPGGYLSASRVGKYLTCAESFRRTYVEGKKFKGNANMSLGSTVHAMVEFALKKRMETEALPSLEESLDHAQSAFDASFASIRDDIDSSELSELRQQSEDLYKIWHKTLAPSIQPLAVEKAFEKNIAGAKVIGFIDLIDGANGKETVVDLKVVKRAKREAEAKNSVQLGVYSIATGIRSVGFDSLVKTIVPSAKIVRAELTEHDTAWIEEIIRTTAESIMAGVFPKTSPDSWVCNNRFCDHYDDCRGASAFVPVSSIK